MKPGLVSHIQTFCLHDGDGIRTTVFLAGCPLRCRWCANPETWDTSRATPMSAEDVLGRCLKDRIFYHHSGGGMTISGGEPGSQPAFLHHLLDIAKGEGLHTSLESSGLFTWQKMLPALQLADFLFFDLKVMDDEAHRRVTGKSNRGILENIRLAGKLGKEMVIRMPLVPTVNDHAANLIATAEFVRTHVPDGRIELLPFHDWARKKYAELALSWHPYRVPDATELLAAQKILVESGIEMVDYK